VETTKLILFLGVLLAGISLITGIISGTRSTVREVYVRELANQTSPVSLTVLIGLSDYSSVSTLELVIVNSGLKPATLNVSCIDRVERIELGVNESISVSSLKPPCWIIPESPVNLNITVRITREVMPYAPISIISLLCLVLSLSLVSIYVYTTLVKKTTSSF
jgi:hypothetical protein